MPTRTVDVFEKSLSRDEVKALLLAVKRHSRFPHRDGCLFWLMYRHGLRVSEAVGLHWDNINLEELWIFIKRAKGSISGYHPLSKEDIQYLKQHRRSNRSLKMTDALFITQKECQMRRNSVVQMMSKYSPLAGIKNAHPHMLRHACGNHMALSGIPTINIQQWLGHRNITNTVIYTEAAGRQFDNLKEWW